MAVTIDSTLCVGCGCCSDVCIGGALELREKAVVSEDHCIECHACIEMCPALAISLCAVEGE